MTGLMIVCRDPISRIALGALGPFGASGVTFADPAEAVARARAAPPATILVDADEPDSTILIAALSLVAAAPIFAFATGTAAAAPLTRAGARAVLRKPTGRTVLPGDPVLSGWRDEIGVAA